LRTGSGVFEVQMYQESEHNGFHPLATHGVFRGQSVMVDLPNGMTLFTLLRSHNNYEYPLQPMLTVTSKGPPTDIDVEGNTATMRLMARMMALKGPQILPQHGLDAQGSDDTWPLMVTFRDIRDPKSVEAIDPDNLATTFGQVYRLRRIIVELTNDPVSTGMEKRWPWFKSLYKPGISLDGLIHDTIATRDLAVVLGPDMFSTELSR
jgi:hypothetical protein